MTDLRLRAAHYGATLARAAIELYTPPSPDIDSADLAAQLGGYLSLPLGPTGAREATPPALVAIARTAYQAEVIAYLAQLARYVERATAPAPPECECVRGVPEGQYWTPCARHAAPHRERPPAPAECPDCRGRGWQTYDPCGTWRAPRDDEGAGMVPGRDCPTCAGKGEVTK